MKRWALLVGLLPFVAARTRGAEDTAASTTLIEPVDETPTTTIPTHTSLNDDDLHLVLLRNQHQPLYPNALGLERPAFVSTPIVPEPAVAPDRSSEDVATITIDAEVDTAEWDAAGLCTLDGAPFAEYRWFYGKDRLRIRVDYATEVLGDDAAGFDVYLGLPAEPGLREAMLSDYDPVATGSVDDLGDTEFAQITPVASP